MTDIAPTARVHDYIARFRRFLNEDVAPIERDLVAQDAGTPWQPKLDANGRMHAAVWEARRTVQRRAGALGLYAPHIQEHLGGGGFGRVEMQHIQEFIYRTSGLGLGLAALAWTEGPGPATEHVSPALRERYLLPLVRGELTAAFANTEPSGGSDVLGMHTTARRDGTDWVIDGHKAWITAAWFADVIQLTAVTDPGAGTRSLSMFIMDGNTPGLRRGVDNPTILDDGLTGELHFDSVRLPAENLVGEVGDGFALGMSFINWRRLDRGGMCAGWGEWLIGRAVERAQSRSSGGKPIADYQAIQHMLAQMDADVYQARATSLVAQAELDRIGPFSMPLPREAHRLISLVKLINDASFYRVADTAIQVHGAKGLGRGTPEEKLFRIARNLRIPAGTTEVQLNALARGLLRPR